MEQPKAHASASGGPGIAQTKAFNGPAFEKAVEAMLDAAGVEDRDHLSKTAVRVRELWEHRLLGGYQMDPAEVLGDGFADAREDIVILKGISVHGVCRYGELETPFDEGSRL